jgi:spore coat protein U-like protein
MKKLLIAAAISAAGLQIAGSQAASTDSTFDVTINLTSACNIGAIAAVDFAYTSFQGGAQASTGGTFNLTCTNTLPYTFGLQAGAGAAVPPGAATINVTDAAVNLAYVLTSPTNGTANGAAQAKTITGSMAAAQGGNCASATCSNAASGNRTQTLIVNF